MLAAKTVPYIAVVKNPSSVDINRNTYAIVLNGVSSDLVKHSATPLCQQE